MGAPIQVVQPDVRYGEPYLVLCGKLHPHNPGEVARLQIGAEIFEFPEDEYEDLDYLQAPHDREALIVRDGYSRDHLDAAVAHGSIIQINPGRSVSDNFAALSGLSELHFVPTFTILSERVPGSGSWFISGSRGLAAVPDFVLAVLGECLKVSVREAVAAVSRDSDIDESELGHHVISLAANLLTAGAVFIDRR